MIKLDLLDELSDSELDQIEAYSRALKKRRDDDLKAKAMENARAVLAAAGLSPKDLLKGKPKASKGPQYKGGQIYQHPTNKALTWNAKGQKPKWLRELEANSQRAIEVSQEVRKAS